MSSVFLRRCINHDNQSYTDSFSGKEFHGCNLKLISRAPQVGLTIYSNLFVLPGKKVQTVIDSSNYSGGQVALTIHGVTYGSCLKLMGKSFYFLVQLLYK